MEVPLPIKTTVKKTFRKHGLSIIPSAMAAMGSRQGIDKEPLTPTQSQYRNNKNNCYKNKNFVNTLYAMEAIWKLIVSIVEKSVNPNG